MFRLSTCESMYKKNVKMNFSSTHQNVNASGLKFQINYYGLITIIIFKYTYTLHTWEATGRLA